MEVEENGEENKSDEDEKKVCIAFYNLYIF